MKGVLGALANAVHSNRPSRKPQLWEDLPLALTRRLLNELAERVRPAWLDRGHVVDLSKVGWQQGGDPPRMVVFPRESMHRAIFLYGVYEISETRLVQALLGEGMTFVDVGANTGYYSLIAARAVGDTGAVHAFEPNDEVRAFFERNVSVNGFESRICIHREAISRTTGEIRFYRSVTESNSGLSSTLPGPGRSKEPTVVPCTTLDEFAERLDKPIDLIKVDVEGSELDVFAGGQRVLGAARAPTILFESFEIEPYLAVLGALGYSVRRLHYTLADGLDLRGPQERFDHLFASYEAPNYVAVKDPDAFAEIVALVNGRRPGRLRILGRL